MSAMSDPGGLDVAGLRAAAEGATPGPWEQFTYEFRDGETTWELVRPMTVGGHRVHPLNILKSSSDGTEWQPNLKDARYIAAADPATVLALLDRLEAAEATVARVRGLRESRWDSIPVWGPDERGLMILDGVDLEGLMADLDWVLEGPFQPSSAPVSASGEVDGPRCQHCGCDLANGRCSWCDDPARCDHPESHDAHETTDGRCPGRGF